MALQIITGDYAVNKKRSIIEMIHNISQADASAVIYYVIPDHIKFDMESLLLDELRQLTHQSQASMINIQVVSFSRITWFLLPHMNKNHTSLSDVGLKMIIRQILLEIEQELIVYRSQIHYQGFIDKLLDLFLELRQGNITPEILNQLLETYDVNELNYFIMTEQQRLSEIHLIYSTFLEQLSELHISYNDDYHQLIDFLSQCEPDPHLYIIIDHHYFFNGDQMQLLRHLIQVAQDVWIPLPITTEQAHSDSYIPIIEIPRKTYHQLKELCAIYQLPLKEDWEMSQRLDYDEGLYQLAQTYFKINSFSPVHSLEQSIPIELWQADTIQTEIKHVANQINYLVHQHHYRYKDIIVLTRDFETYSPVIAPYFAMNNIPYFIDNTQEMSQHPFVLLLDGLLKLSIRHWDYTSIMAILKSDFVIPPFLYEDSLDYRQVIKEKRRQVHLIENIIIENGYVGYRLYSPNFDWNFEGQETQYINADGEVTERTYAEVVAQWREWFVNLSQLLLSREIMSGEQFAEGVYQLVDSLSVPALLEQHRDYLIEEGQIELSLREEQVWNAYIDLLDEFYSIYSSSELDYDTFVDIFLEGMQESNFLIIPPTMDQVTITNMVSPQVQPYKVAFIIGMNQHTMPSSIRYDSLLNKEERERIAQLNLLPYQYLANNYERQFNSELFLMYQLLLSATDMLYISYAQVDNDQSLEWSPYIQELCRYYEFEPLTFKLGIHKELINPHTSAYGQYPMQRSLALFGHRLYWEHQINYPEQFRSLLSSLIDYETAHTDLRYPPIIDSMRNALVSFNKPESIRPQTALALYGKNLLLSVSKVEEYYRDPYSHFLKYGLKLKERRAFELDFGRSGDYFHEFLDQFTKVAKEASENDILTLNHDELLRLSDLTSQQILTDIRFNILSSNPRMMTIREQMNEQMRHIVANFIEKIRLTKFQPVMTEVIFGLNPRGDLLGPKYSLQSGGQMSVTGKIDRIDELRLGNGEYYQVIDYKSTGKSFDLKNVFYGIDLQLLTYMNVVKQNRQDQRAFGAFYQPLLVKLSDQLASSPYNHLVLQTNQYKGFVNIDEEVATSIDVTLDELGKSLIYPISVKKDGNYAATSQHFNDDMLATLLSYVDYMFIRAGNEIQQGNIALSPFRDEVYTPSLQPGIRTITGFDATEHYHIYRDKVVTNKHALEEIQQRLEAYLKGDSNDFQI